MGKIEKILKKGPVEGQTTEVYPVTSTKAVYDENNKRLDNIITGLQESVYLNNPIPISTENTPESIAQNVKNIADYVEKAKAAGIADVNGMAVTCIIDGDNSAVGYLYGEDVFVGILLYDDNSLYYVLISNGSYTESSVVIKDASSQVTSDMLVQGARKPIILTPSTTKVDEATYQKLLSDDVDVMFMNSSSNLCTLTNKDSGWSGLILYFTCFSVKSKDVKDSYISSYTVSITKDNPHTCRITKNYDFRFSNFLIELGYLKNSTLSPVLQEIDLTGTDADRKAKLTKFETNWKALTGASDLTGARFVAKGSFDIPEPPRSNILMTYVESGLVAAGYTGIVIAKNSMTGLTEAYNIHITLEGVISYNKIRDEEAFEAFQQFSLIEVPATYLKITDAEATYETKANLAETLKDYAKPEEVIAIGNIATANAITAIKQYLTSVPFTDTTSSNKAQLEEFLYNAPDATVMHCTYKDVYAGTLYKINSDWYGLLVKNTNNPADNINIKLSADGTIIEGNSTQ